MRPIVLLAVGVAALFAVRAQPSAAACPAIPQPATMDNPAYYDFVSTYNGDCAANTNWDRSFPDATISRKTSTGDTISVTTSTALAGAIASLKLNGREYIASGGHGSSLQWAFHAWRAGTSATECYNPTQAGSRSDDAGKPPYHGPSTSALYVHRTTSASTITAQLRPAMYIPLSSPDPGSGGCRASDVQPNRSPYTFGLSPYWLSTQVSLAPDNGRPDLDNVVRLTARLTSEDQLYANFDGLLVAYLQRAFSDAFAVDLGSGALQDRGPAAPGTNRPVVRCTPDRTACLGMYFHPSAMPSAYYYTLTNGPTVYNGMAGEYTAQVTIPASTVGAGGQTTLDYDVDIAVGNLARTVAALRALSAASSPPPTGPSGPAGTGHHRASLSIQRARLTGRTLDLRGTLRPAVDGTASVRLGRGRRARTVSATVHHGRIAVRRRVPAHGSTAPVELAWPGDATTLPARAALLAAKRSPRLRVTRMRFDAGSHVLSLRGRVARSVHGVVVLQTAGDDTGRSTGQHVRVRIRRGRFSWHGRLTTADPNAVVTVTYRGSRRGVSGAAYARALADLR
jgi:hypothetical protein